MQITVLLNGVKCPKVWRGAMWMKRSYKRQDALVPPVGVAHADFLAQRSLVPPGTRPYKRQVFSDSLAPSIIIIMAAMPMPVPIPRWSHLSG